MEGKSIPNQQYNQLENLESRSHSSCTDNLNPFFYGGPPPQQSHLNDQQILDKKELHNLVQNSERTIEVISKQEVEKYVKRVIDLNNQAYYKNQILEKESSPNEFVKQGSTLQLRGLEKTPPGLEKNSKTIQSISSKNKKRINASPVSDKIENQITTLLCEAQTILEYAASCGKTIDRNLIICVLCNQAAFYQKVWDLKSSCIYLQAVIINMEQWGEESQWSQYSGGSLSIMSKNTTPFFEMNFLTNNGQANIEDDVILMNMRKWRILNPGWDFSTRGDLHPEEDEKLARNYELDNNVSKLSIYRNCEQLQFKEPNNRILNIQYIQETNPEKIRHHITQLFQLSIFYLQYSSLCGQMGAHKQAIDTTMKVIRKLRKVSVLNQRKLFSEQGTRENTHYKYSIHSQEDILEIDNRKVIFGLSELDYEMSCEISDCHVENYRQTAKYFLNQLNKVYPANQRSQKSESRWFRDRRMSEQSMKSNEQKIQQQEIIFLQKELKNFVISDLLKIKCRNYSLGKKSYRAQYLAIDSQIKKNYTKMQENQPQSIQQNNQYPPLFSITKNTNTFSFMFLFPNAILLSTAYFILATEFRLLAVSEQKNQGQRFESVNYRKSEIMHLTAIIILCVYVPIDMKYLKHMITSYQNYYLHILNPVDLKNNEYENEAVTDSNLKKQNILKNKFDKYHIYKAERGNKSSIKTKQNLQTIKEYLKRGKTITDALILSDNDKQPKDGYQIKSIPNSNYELSKQVMNVKQTKSPQIKTNRSSKKTKKEKTIKTTHLKKDKKEEQDGKNSQHETKKKDRSKKIKSEKGSKNKQKGALKNAHNQIKEDKTVKSPQQSLQYLPSQSLSFRALICEEEGKADKSPFFNSLSYKQMISQPHLNNFYLKKKLQQESAHSLFQKKNIKSLSKSTNMLSEHSKVKDRHSKNSNLNSNLENETKKDKNITGKCKVAIDKLLYKKKKNKEYKVRRHYHSNHRRHSQQMKSKPTHYTLHQHLNEEIKKKKPKFLEKYQDMYEKETPSPKFDSANAFSETPYKHKNQLLCFQQKMKKYEPTANFSTHFSTNLPTANGKTHTHTNMHTHSGNEKSSVSPKSNKKSSKFRANNSKKSSVCSIDCEKMQKKQRKYILSPQNIKPPTHTGFKPSRKISYKTNQFFSSPIPKYNHKK